MLNIDDLIIDAQQKLANTTVPRMPFDSEAVQEHVTRFVAEVSKDPRCMGLLTQLSICIPHGASDYVLSLHLAKSGNDTQSAIDALARKPTSTEISLSEE